jgi:UDP-glucose 4-epimerase
MPRPSDLVSTGSLSRSPDRLTWEEISIEDLASLIRSKLNSSSPICYIHYDQAYEEGFEDMQRRVPSTAKIEHCVGWRPSTSLNTMIDLIAEYFRQ